MKTMMKIKEGFTCNQVGGKWIVTGPEKEELEFDGARDLRESFHDLWSLLSEGCELTDLSESLTRTQCLHLRKAYQEALSFTENLKSFGCLEVYELPDEEEEDYFAR